MCLLAWLLQGGFQRNDGLHAMTFFSKCCQVTRENGRQQVGPAAQVLGWKLSARLVPLLGLWSPVCGLWHEASSIVQQCKGLLDNGLQALGFG